VAKDSPDQQQKGGNMATRQVNVQRFSLMSSRGFDEVIAAIEGVVGRPNMNTFLQNITAAQTEAELERVVNGSVGSTGLMEFTRFDLGEVLRKEAGSSAPRSIRLVAGNPLIMKQMVKLTPDAGSYAPVTILIDERADGVHLSYDTMVSFLAPYGNSEALRVAQDLDEKVEALLKAAAASG
jgi:uncharacterized protein (DUF302 family)